MTTSRPVSVMRLARSTASSATRHCSSTDSSKVDANTSPFTARRISVTSSGRSPMSTTIRMTSGRFCETAAAICLNTVVLPALGGDTTSPRCPKPMGANRSIMREGRPPCGFSSTMWSLGKMGVRDSKMRRFAWFCCSGSSRLMLVTRVRPWCRSPSLGGRTVPVTVSPVFRLDRRICDCPTKTSPATAG